MPNQPVTSKPGTVSASGRTSGNSAEPPVSASASSRSCRPAAGAGTSARLVIMKSVRPPRMSTHRRRRPAIGDVDHVDAGLLLQQLARQVLRGADPGAAEADLAGPGAGRRQHVLHAAIGALGRDHEAVGGQRQVADRRQRLPRVERQVGADQLRRDRHGAHRALEKRGAVGGAAGHLGGADHAVHAGAVLDHDAGTEERPERLGDQPCDEVGGAAGGEAADQADGALLRHRGRRQRRAQQHSQHDAPHPSLPGRSGGDPPAARPWTQARRRASIAA